MPRITSQKTRQMLLVTGDPLNPLELPERVQLYNEAGQTVDVTQDPSKMRWAGVWVIDQAYVWNDVVMDTGNLYILTNPAGLPAGEPRPSESESDDWFLLTVAPPPPPPAFHGDWAADVLYPAGSIVVHDGASYATTVEVSGMEPGVPTGSDWGMPVLGVQVKSTDKIDDNVLKVVSFGPDSPVDGSGDRFALVGIDFVSSAADVNLHVVNNTNQSLIFGLYSMTASAQPGAGIDNALVDSGDTGDVGIRFATYYGLSESILLIRGAADSFGDVELTFTGGNLVPPDIANPWMAL